MQCDVIIMLIQIPSLVDMEQAVMQYLTTKFRYWYVEEMALTCPSPCCPNCCSTENITPVSVGKKNVEGGGTLKGSHCTFNGGCMSLLP